MADLIPSHSRRLPRPTIVLPSGCGCASGVSHASHASPAGGPEPGAAESTEPRVMNGVGVVSFDGLPGDWTVAMHPWPEGAAAPESAVPLDPRAVKIPAGHYAVRVRGPSGEEREWETTVEPDRETRLDFAAARITREAPPAPPPPPPPPGVPGTPGTPGTPGAAARTVAQVIITGAPTGASFELRPNPAPRNSQGPVEAITNSVSVPFRASGGTLVADATSTGRWIIVENLPVDNYITGSHRVGSYVAHPLSLDAGTRTEVPYAELIRVDATMTPPVPPTNETDAPPQQSGTNKALVGITIAMGVVATWALLDRSEPTPRSNPSKARHTRQSVRRNARNARNTRRRGR